MKKSSVVHCSSSSTGPRDTDMSKYKGVRKRKWGKWVSEIRLPNSRDRIWLGSYDSPIKAARAFDAAQFCLRGESANYNFPNNPPDITRTGRSMTPSEIQAVATRFANQPLDEPEFGPQCTVEMKDEDESVTSSVLDGDTSSTAHIESDVTRVDESFYNLNATLGSGNFGSEYVFFNGFDDFGPVNFGSSEPDGLDYGLTSEDCYDASIYQGSFLWNF